MTITLNKPEKSEYWSIVDGDGIILDSGRLTPRPPNVPALWSLK